jgi:hypothetical protein
MMQVMAMARVKQRSGLSLVLAGIAGVAFFWLSDPRWGITGQTVTPDIVDAIHQASPGTWIGMAGGAVVAVIGLWLLTRKTA